MRAQACPDHSLSAGWKLQYCIRSEAKGRRNFTVPLQTATTQLPQLELTNTDPRLQIRNVRLKDRRSRKRF
jgi:hypothetical protein